MDFAKLNTAKAAENTFKFEVLHPVTAEETGVFFSVYSSESDVVKQFRTRLFRKVQKQEFENMRNRKPKLQDIEELEKDALENALARLAGWENLEWEGKELEFTQENAHKVLTACPWLCTQITEQSDNLGNFLKA